MTYPINKHYAAQYWNKLYILRNGVYDSELTTMYAHPVPNLYVVHFNAKQAIYGLYRLEILGVMWFYYGVALLVVVDYRVENENTVGSEIYIRRRLRVERSPSSFIESCVLCERLLVSTDSVVSPIQ